MKTIKTTRITATDVHEKLIGQLEALVTSEDWKAFLRTAARFHRYSANNCMLILAQCPEATQVASFTTWRSFGRFPRRNETAIRILAPCDEDLGNSSDPLTEIPQLSAEVVCC
jgi:hypothetical protein